MTEIGHEHVVAAFEEAERHAQAVLKNAPGILVHAGGPLLFHSRTLPALLGHEALPDDAVGSVLALVPPEARDTEMEFYRACLAGDAPKFVRRVKRLHQNGRIEWLDQLIDLVTWQDRPALLEYLLPASRPNAGAMGQVDRWQAALDAMPHGVLLLDKDLIIEDVNSASLALWSYPPGMMERGCPIEVSIRYNWERGDYGDKSVNEMIALAKSHLQATGIMHWERQVSDGRFIEVRSTPRSDGGYVVTQIDITERKLTADALRREKERAEQALADLKAAQDQLIVKEKMATLGQMTARIAHEIKNPLNFINNFASLSADFLEELTEAIEHGDLDAVRQIIPTLTHNLRAINDHGTRLDNIVQAALLHARGSSEGGRTTDIKSLIDQAAELAYLGSGTNGADIALDRDLPPGPLLFDLVPQDMLRVLVNLIANALYSVDRRRRAETGPYRPAIKITARCTGDHLEIRIRDNGLGLPAAVREHLFTPFFTTKPPGEGTGLGLSLSYDIVVHQHGGRLTVESVEGDYAEFVIVIPSTAGESLNDR